MVKLKFCLSNFFRHGHPIQHTQLIICWIIDRFDNIEQDNTYKWRKFLITEDSDKDIYDIDADGEPGDEPIGKLTGKNNRPTWF